MDNVTHVLAGLFVAELAGRVRARRAEPSREFMRAAYFASALANNLPDFDFVYTGITPGKLGYLLHHRGHTHTLGIGLLLGLVPIGLVWIWARRRAMGFDRVDWRWLVGLSLAGPLLHITMDFANTYGVHPFWPISSRWFFGDLLFIVEPFLWAAVVPQLLFATRAIVGKILLVALLAATAFLPIFLAYFYVPQRVGLAILVITVVWAVVSFRFSRTRGAVAALIALVVVIGVFAVGRRIARSRIDAAVRNAFPNETLHDFAATPFPGDPLCWAFVTVGSTPDGSYTLRRGRLSLAPGLIAAEACAPLQETHTAPLVAIGASRPPELLLDRELTRPRAELRALRENCETAAYLRFTRIPFWRDDSPDKRIVGDLRFDRGPSLDFAELALNPKAPRCPSWVPPWIPPRSDLLDER